MCLCGFFCVCCLLLSFCNSFFLFVWEDLGLFLSEWVRMTLKLVKKCWLTITASSTTQRFFLLSSFLPGFLLFSTLSSRIDLSLQQILKKEKENSKVKYLIHYLGWRDRYTFFFPPHLSFIFLLPPPLYPPSSSFPFLTLL